MRLLLSHQFEKKIRDARYSVGEDRFIVTFDSGKEYSFPRSSMEVDDGSDLLNIQVDRGRFFFRVTQVSDNRYEIPWDRVLHEAEPAYQYFRGRLNRTKTRQEIGATIRKLREAKGVTQLELARAAGMMRANISRIEAPTQPRNYGKNRDGTQSSGGRPNRATIIISA